MKMMDKAVIFACSVLAGEALIFIGMMIALSTVVYIPHAGILLLACMGIGMTYPQHRHKYN